MKKVLRVFSIGISLIMSLKPFPAINKLLVYKMLTHGLIIILIQGNKILIVVYL